MTDPIVDIDRVFGDAIRVPITDLRPGDYVFDAYGRRYEVHNVRVTRSTVTAYLVSGNYPFIYDNDGETITIVRGVKA